MDGERAAAHFSTLLNSWRCRLEAALMLSPREAKSYLAQLRRDLQAEMRASDVQTAGAAFDYGCVLQELARALPTAGKAANPGLWNDQYFAAHCMLNRHIEAMQQRSGVRETAQEPTTPRREGTPPLR